MAELADAHGSGPCKATCGGSNPFDRTNKLIEHMETTLICNLGCFFVFEIIGQKEFVKIVVNVGLSIRTTIKKPILQVHEIWVKNIN